MNHSDKVDHLQQNDSSELAFQFCSLQELSNAYRDRDKEQDQGKITIDGKKYKLRIPPIQRGLVWNPAQVETLWDSILRGFPIGSLSLLHGDDPDTLEIIDGQQRTNAISLGFENPFCKDACETEKKPILWIDVWPKANIQPRRKYRFCLTTSSQPWGYALINAQDETETRLLTQAKRYSILFKQIFTENFEYKKPDILDLYPISDNVELPMPFSLLRGGLLSDANEETFVDIIRNSEYGRSEYGPRKWWENFEKKIGEKPFEDVWKKIKELREIIKCRLDEYKVPMMIIPRSTVTGDNSTDAEDNLSVYFSRLNTNGTVPDAEEIRYSILKTALPELKVLENKLSESDINIMRPSRMATFAIRLYKTENKGEWVDSIEQNDVHDCRIDNKFQKFITADNDQVITADNDQAFEKRILTLKKSIVYGTEKQWGIPKYLLAIIAQHNLNLFQFLLCLVGRLEENSNEDKNGKKIAGLATLLQMFSNKGINYEKAYNTILKNTDDASPSQLWNKVSSWLGTAIRSHQLILPPTTKTFDEICIRKDEIWQSDDLNELEKKWHPDVYSSGLNRVWSWGNGWRDDRENEPSGSILAIYAYREYMETIFKGYNPVSAAYKDDTCPWDRDHIIPKSWYRYKEDKEHMRQYAQDLIESTGNLAHIPCCINRAKSNLPPFNFCGSTKYMGEKYNKKLYVDSWDADTFEILKKENVDMVQKENILQAAPLITSRLHKLYEAWYGRNGLDIEGLLNFKSESDGILHVKNAPEIKFFDKIRELFKESSGEQNMPPVYFLCDGAYEKGKQKEINDEKDYCRPFLSSGYKVENTKGEKEGIIGISLLDSDTFEYGFRRHPSKSQINDDPNKWWHNRPDDMPSGQWENTQGNLLYKNGRLADYNNEAKMNEVIDELMILYRFFHENK